jgi:hypothetical protein
VEWSLLPPPVSDPIRGDVKNKNSSPLLGEMRVPGRDADQQMGERKAYDFRLVLAVDLTDAKSNGYRDRMNG